MSCYKWELEAIIEGLELKRLDELDTQATFGFWLRYILNAKKPKREKVFNKRVYERRIREAFGTKTEQRKNSGNKVQKMVAALNHFKNRR